MPVYDYRCTDCREEFSVERSMSDDTKQNCTVCGTENVNRIWNITFRTGGVIPDYGQGTASTTSSQPAKAGCSTCSTKACSTC